MISKEQEDNKVNETWENGIFTIPNDLYYFQQKKYNVEKENENSKIDENSIIKESIDEKTVFTNLLTPNWKKHINNYVRHKFSGHRKKIRKIYQINDLKSKEIK